MADNNEHSAPASYLARLFDRHQVGERQRSAVVTKVLGLAYHAAHRRLTGLQEFTLDELRRVAEHFGESLDELFLLAKADRTVEAVLVVDGQEVPCMVWLGEPHKPAAGGSLVAGQAGSRWRVIWSSGSDDNGMAPLFEVAQLLVRSSRRRIAVLDDDKDITEAVCESLEAAGFSARGFDSVDDLRAAAAALPFDAYILDWMVGETTARSLINDLTVRAPGCPIAVLTGQVGSADVIAQDIAETVAAHDIDFYEKPVTMAIVTARLARKLKSVPARLE